MKFSSNLLNLKTPQCCYTYTARQLCISPYLELSWIQREKKLMNLHLGLGEQERHQQMGHLLSHHLFRRSQGLPTLIAGDTNDWRNTLAEGPLAEHGFQHCTHPISRFRTFPAYLPVGSLDKVFCSSGIRISNLRVVRTKSAKAASDHLPLVIDFHCD